jgi:hypothetical protein
MSGIGAAMISFSKGLLLLIPLAAGGFLLSGCSDEEHAATLRVTNPFKDAPGPTDTRLQLVAEGVEGCSDGDHEVVDVTVEETDTEVVVGAEIRTGREFSLTICEIRDIQERFVVELDRPLGRRLVIDDSRGGREVIWSPQRRAEFVRAQRLNPSDAEALLRSKFPAAEAIQCGGGGGGRYFGCSVTVPSRRKPVAFYVYLRAGGGLNPIAGERLPPELRTCEKQPGRPSDFEIC